MNARKIGLVTAMWLLGLASIAGFTWAVEWLDGQPVRVAAAADPPPAVAARQPLAALTAGAARAAATARRDLASGQRSEASHAIDAALRATEVGLENSHGMVKKAYEAALQRIHYTRQDLHNGWEASARQELRHAVEELTRVIEPARTQSPGTPAPLVWNQYNSATLLDSTGATIGEVNHIERGPNGMPVAVLQVGGASDVLGFLDFGGRTERVPADRLLWGPRRFIGSTFAALAVQDADDIRGTG
ncbi:hypothetical protein SacmaDRAFT_2506 [Saccharomonospora marina XMU15]|uniref:Uncharacterized protein n=1 Tax=Saccharomonospora marina XMU15 TaxID=882083 RepID=H5WZL7_9PSEU|nr:hypothetical protein [Saccharomonospora marina]EHR50749.1 hypothetical protein SacmaDRAFT_2506 [Saccharomonospora marina XMU15]